MKKALTVAVMCATSLSPIMTSAALAYAIEDPNPWYDGQELAGMQEQCDAIAASYDTGNGDIWTGVVVVSGGNATLVSGPTEVDGTRVIDPDSVEPAGEFHPATVEIVGDPYRIGGSVNMFGDARSTAGFYDASTYNYTADFDSTFSYAFDCEIYQAVFHPEVIHPLSGYYDIIPHGGIPSEDEEAIRNNCIAYTAMGAHENRPPWWGEDHAGCTFFDTTPPPEPEFHDPAELVDTVAGVPILEDQTDSLEGFEPNGGPVEVEGDFFVGQVVICISPANPAGGKKGVPGEWRTQNGYTGDKCTTDWFNQAPWGGGSQDSQGTYISVPAV